MESENVLNAFLKRILADLERNTLQPLEVYQRLWPGHDKQLAEEYARVKSPAALAADGGSGSGQELSHFGQYLIVRELGRGGQGIVYLARDERLDRQVALKVLTGHSILSPAALTRFRREAAAASRLDHPGICPVYEAGVSSAVPYIAMRYVPGETLTRWIALARDEAEKGGGNPTSFVLDPSDTPPKGREEHRTRRSSSTQITSTTREKLATVLRIVEGVARALHAAHEAGIIHRDMKPGNVMVTPEGEAVVLDFGMARIEDDDEGTLTMSGDLFGTPAYMAPEQLAGQRIHLDRRIDVYALGVILYESLTLRRPFQAPTRAALYQQILSAEPPAVRRLNPVVPRDLAVVVETAMARSPNDRYQTALDLADELRCVRDRRPILARPAGPLVRLSRWARRRPGLAASILALFVTLVTGLGVTMHLLRVATAERDVKAEALDEARRQRAEKEEALEEARAEALSRASAAALKADPMLALLLAREAARLDLTGSRQALRAALHASHERARMPGHYAPVERVVWTPGGRRVFTCSRDGTAKLWARSGEPAAELRGHEGAVLDGAVSPDGTLLATASDDHTARLWSTDGRTIAVLPHQEAVCRVSFSADGEQVLTASRDGTARAWDPRGRLIHEIDVHTGPLLAACFLRDGAAVMTVCEDGTAAVTDLDTGTARTFRSGSEGATDAVVAPDGSSLAVTCRSGHIELWDPEAGLEIVLEGAKGVAFAPQDERILTWSADGTCRILDQDGRELRVVVAGAVPVTWSAWTPGGEGVLIATENGALTLHGDGGRAAVLLGRHDKPVRCGALDPRRLGVATGSEDGGVRLWSLKAVEPWTDLWSGAKGAAFSSNGRRLVVFGDHVRRVYGVCGERPAPVILEEERLPAGQRFLLEHRPSFAYRLILEGRHVRLRGPGGRILASATAGHEPGFGEVAPGGEAFAIASKGSSPGLLVDVASDSVHEIGTAVAALTFLHGGRLAVAGWRPLRIYSRTGELVADGSAWHAEGGKYCIGEVLVSPDRSRIACHGASGRLYLIDREFRLEHLLTQIGGYVRKGMVWSPGGDHLLIGSTDRGAQVVDAQAGTMRHLLADPGSPLVGAYVTGDRVVTCDGSGTVTLWEGGRQMIDRYMLPDSSLSKPLVAPDRSFMALLSETGVHLARCNDRHLMELADALILRDFTRTERERHQTLLGDKNRSVLKAWKYVRTGTWYHPVRARLAAAAAQDPALSEPVRARLQDILAGLPEDLRALNHHSWTILTAPEAEEEDLRRALEMAETLVRCVPASGGWLNTLGVAQYRLGDLTNALATLERSDRMNRRQLRPGGIGEDVAVMAMAQHRLGRTEDFARTVDRLRAMFSEREPTRDEAGFLRELERLSGVRIP